MTDLPEQRPASVWIESFTVRSFEMDVSGHLGIIPLCNYLQEVAGKHARELGVSMEQLQSSGLTWMLSRLHVQVVRYPAWRETVIVETWPSGHNGLLASREFLMRTEQGEAIGKGTSAWLLIDLQRHRPIRMPEFVDALVLPDRPRPVPDPFNKLPAPGETDEEAVFSVGYHDLDINRHANNVHYIRWALEAVPYEVLTGRQLVGLEVQFRAEAKYGDEIVSRIEQEDGEDGLVIRHGLVERSSGKELALVRSRWQ